MKTGNFIQVKTGSRMRQGEKANKNGKILEKTVIPVLEGNGYKIFNNSEVQKNPELIDSLEKYALKNVPYNTIYGRKGRTELVIFNKAEARCIRVEMKYQVTVGSVDEKFPYMFLNGIFAYPADTNPVHGNGYKRRLTQIGLITNQPTSVLH